MAKSLRAKISEAIMSPSEEFQGHIEGHGIFRSGELLITGNVDPMLSRLEKLVRSEVRAGIKRNREPSKLDAFLKEGCTIQGMPLVFQNVSVQAYDGHMQVTLDVWGFPKDQRSAQLGSINIVFANGISQRTMVSEIREAVERTLFDGKK